MIGRTTVAVLAATFITAVGTALASVAQNPIGWSLTALAAIGGLIGPWLAERYGRRGIERLPVWDLPTPLARLVTEAAADADRLRHLAQRSPAGPVADHFDRLAQTADRYVVAIHGSARTVVDGEAPELEDELATIVGQLAELVEAAERLRLAQRRHLDVSPLAALTSETEELTATIESQFAQGEPGS